MENLKQYTAKIEVEKILETSGLPTYAKLMIAKEVAMNYEKRYLDDVKAEYNQLQKSKEIPNQSDQGVEPKIKE